MKRKTRANPLRDASGFTLTEVLIWAGLTILSMAAIFGVMLANIEGYVGATTRLSAEESLLRAESLLKRVIRQALNVQSFPTTIVGDGWINTGYNSTVAGTGNFGLFFRESSARAVTVPRFTGLFFVAPVSAAGVHSPGALIIDLDSNGDNQVSYNYAEQYVSNLVSLRVLNPVTMPSPPGAPTNGFPRLSSVEIEITIRQFVGTQPMNRRCYLPKVAGVSVCDVGSDGKDVTRTFSILLRNNEFAPPQLTPYRARALGPLYFLQEAGGGVVQ